MEAEFGCVAGVGEKTPVRRSGEDAQSTELLTCVALLHLRGRMLHGVGGEGVVGR